MTNTKDEALEKCTAPTDDTSGKGHIVISYNPVKKQ